MLDKTSDVPNLMDRLIVTRKGILFTFITLMAKVTKRYRSRMSDGIGDMLTLTDGGVERVVFPLRDPRLGPNISSAATTSSTVKGQLGSEFVLII